MKYIFIHGLGQRVDSWNKTISGMKIREQDEIECLDVFTMADGADLSYGAVYKAFSLYCESVEGEFGLCGLSLGAVLALNYAEEHPHKVKSLVLIGGQCVMPKRLLRFQNMMFRIMPEGAFKSMGMGKREILQLTNSMMELNLERALGMVECRTLVVCGEKDRANRSASQLMAEKIGGARLEIIKDCGHEVNVQAPEKLAEVLDAFYNNQLDTVKDRS